jgi:2-polyprenyl-3-methyl-5-hydroxy-6-metoxy-1,4-benzoquinol methylase
LTDGELEDLYSDYYLDDFSFTTSNEFKDCLDGYKKYRNTREFLSEEGSLGKTLLDYGCGIDGHGLLLAKELGLQPTGLEISAVTRELLHLKTQLPILAPEVLFNSSCTFDYILVSDVLEHVSNPGKILQSLKPHLGKDGKLIVQGPLEGVKSISNLLINLYNFLTPKRVSYSKPYHVSLGNLKSYSKLFNNNGFSIVRFCVSETWWPVPTSIQRFTDLPKFILQSSVKLIDLAISQFVPNYGSRFWIIATCRKD